MSLHCNRCSGRVFIDRALCHNGNVELFCIICGNRWEVHKSTAAADALNRIERRNGFQ